MLVVAHNLLAQNANRQLKINTGKKAKSTEKLSSGYRINRSADDAAGLAISEKMRFQIRGLDRASQNIQDGVSLVQVADGALSEIHSMLHRMKELAVQASNDTNTDSDRSQLQNEVRELKREISRTFNTTEFNTMPIFRSPYTIGVAEDPDDIQMFNTDASGDQLSGSGGLIFNNKRYTWSELGADVTNGVLNSDFSAKFHDPDNGELIELGANKGDKVTDIIRYYQLTSDTEGVYVNDLPAARWAETSAGGKWAGVDTFDVEDGMYTFTFHGMDISFAPDEEDDRETMIQRLNPDTLSSERTMYFMSRAAGAARESAVHSSSSITNMVLDVTQANKGAISDFAYEVSADDTGVTIRQTNGSDSITHKKIAWSDFKNINTGEEFKFTDWGLSDSGNPQTFDADATYRYTDNTTQDMETAISFTFTVKDEASKQGIIDGLNGIALTAPSVNAPLRAGGTTDKSGVTLSSHVGFSDFEFERDVLTRTFDDAVSPITGTVTRSRNYNGTVGSYAQTHTMKELMVKKVTEVRDDTGALISSNLEYVSLTDQNPADSHEETDPSTGETTKWFYQTNDTGDFEYYYDNGGNMRSADSYIANGIYVQDNGGSTIGNDDDHTAYSSSSVGSSKKKYIYTNTGWSLDKIYRTFTNTYKYTNSNGDDVLSGNGGQHIDTKAGVVDWKGRAVDTSAAKYNAATFEIVDSSGRSSNLSTAFAGESVRLNYTGNSSKFMTLTYNNSLDSADGSGSNFSVVNTQIRPADEATRTFSKADVSKGSSLRTDYESVTAPPPEKLIHIQSGALGFQSIDLRWNGMSLSSIGLGSANVSTYARAQRTMDLVDKATDIVSSARARFGAYQNRLEHAMQIDDYTSENTQAAESRIRDTDMAKESVRYAKHSILEQVGSSVLAQANQSTQGVLNLLQ